MSDRFDQPLRLTKAFFYFFMSSFVLLIGLVLLRRPVVKFYPGPVQVVEAGEQSVAVPTVLIENKSIWSWFGCQGCVLNFFYKPSQIAHPGSLQKVNAVLRKLNVPAIDPESEQATALNLGPSAELGVVLAAYMEHNRFPASTTSIAATGVLSADGDVLPVAGLEQKVDGVVFKQNTLLSKPVLFFVPAEEGVSNTQVELYAVKTVQAALDKVCDSYSKNVVKEIETSCPALSGM